MANISNLLLLDLFKSTVASSSQGQVVTTRMVSLPFASASAAFGLLFKDGRLGYITFDGKILPCSSRRVQAVGSASWSRDSSRIVFETGLIHHFLHAALDSVELSGTTQQNTHLHPHVASYFNIGYTHLADSDRLPLEIDVRPPE